jgi:tetratricopeptide (TPR) repeat protein
VHQFCLKFTSLAIATSIFSVLSISSSHARTSDNTPTLARRRATNTLIEQSEHLALRGEIPAALSKLEEADALESFWGVSATSWNVVCWYGSLWGYAEDVLEACDRALELDPGNIEILDSRGLARSLTGDIDGAIKDFSTFVSETSDENRRYQRQNWVRMLEVGENPFTEEVLQMLFID